MTRSFLSSIVANVILLFSIDADAQSLRVISPNGGEIWEAGTTQIVRWEASGINDRVEIEYSIDGGDWDRIARVEGSGTTQVSWVVDNAPSTAVKVRVITKDGDVSDESDNFFTITADPLEQSLVLSPNGGEVLTSGDQHIIRWQLPADAINAAVDYSTNLGASWTSIAEVQASLSQYLWTIPELGNSEITSALVRVTADGEIDHSDVSDNPFTIRPKVVITPSQLSVAYPNGGEVLQGGSQVNVTWSYMPPSNDDGESEGPELTIQYSTNNGVTWSEIATEDAETGYHSWIVPNVTTTTALVRVFEAGGTLNDTSNAMFAINAGEIENNIRVLAPNGGEVWRTGELRDITWSAVGDAANVRIFLQTTDQQNQTTSDEIANVAASVGRLSWIVPDLGSEPLQARIQIEYGGLDDASDAFFTILPQGSLSVSTGKRDNYFEMRGVYPNPASEYVTFSWSPSGKAAVIATLYNSTGAVVRTTSVNGNSHELRLEIRDLPQGSYFYELLTDGHISRGVVTIAR
jgi:hypothetical protein